MKSAALYLRSSKDRADVSISAQRNNLRSLAQSKGLSVVQEYEDVVESGKSMFRPGFQRLLRDIKDRNRGWTTLLILDTSRLSRQRFHAQAFKHEAQRHDVEIIYAKMPDLDPITAVIVESVFEAMDEVHSLMSKEKGLAGMAENTRQCTCYEKQTDPERGCPKGIHLLEIQGCRYAAPCRSQQGEHRQGQDYPDRH